MIPLLGKLFARRIVEAIRLQKRGRQWHWEMVATNGETLASSETYSTKGDCEDTARAVGAQIGARVVS